MIVLGQEYWTVLDLAREFGKTKQTIYNWSKSPDFPPPWPMPRGGKAWKPDDIHEWWEQQQQIAA